MRIPANGVVPDETAVPFSFDGVSVAGVAGDSVASALVDAGILAFRTAAEDDMRGLFCGMGVCNECAVVVDGTPSRLACLTPVMNGAVVERQPPLPTLPSTLAHPLPEVELTPDVLVVGGGPAGLAAATLAAEAGLDVVVVDERLKLGGQFYKQPPATSAIDEKKLDAQYTEGRQLIRATEESGITTLLGVRIWAAFSPTYLLASGPDRRYTIRPSRLVLATGAYERGVPMPGWTLPGVMTTGAAQTLLRANQVSPGTRVLVAGNGPLNLQVAAEMATAGVTVVGLVEVADVRWWKGMSAGASMALTAPSLVRRGMRYRTSLMKAKVPVMARSSVVSLEGDDSVERATVAQLDEAGQPVPDTERQFGVDAVCMGYGFMPSNEIARSLGCHHRFDESKGYLVTERTATGRTSVPDVWIVGDSGGIAGAHVALASGTLAGLDIVADLGGHLPGSTTARRGTAERHLRRHVRFQRHLWSLYRAPVLVDQLATPNTVVCRCETVTMEDLQAELAWDVQTAGALKRTTRAGMGKCQGRYCGPVLTEMVSRTSGVAIDAHAGFAPQPPSRPTELSLMSHPGHGTSIEEPRPE